MSEQEATSSKKKTENLWANTILWMLKMIVLFNVFAVGMYFVLRHFDIVG